MGVFKLEKLLEQILSEVKGLKEGQKQLETKIGGLESSQERIETRIGSLETGQERLETRMSSLESNQERLESKIDSVDIKLDVLKSSLIEGLAPYFENVEKHVDSTNEKIISTLHKQQASIDVLAARSIQHEADIKSFNRILRNQ